MVSGILVFIVSLGCCLFFCGCRRCKRTRENVYREHNRYEDYRAHYYANKLQLHNENEHDTKNNGTNQQHETVNEDETLQTETEDKKQNHQNDTVIEMKSTQHHTGFTDATDDFFWYTLSDDTDGADDTDDTDNTEEV